MMNKALPLSHVSFCLSLGYCYITVTVSSFAMLDLEFDPAMSRLTLDSGDGCWLDARDVPGRRMQISLLPHLCLKAFPIKPLISSMTRCR